MSNTGVLKVKYGERGSERTTVYPDSFTCAVCAGLLYGCYPSIAVCAGRNKGEGWTVIRVFPRVDNTKLMELFRKGVEGQWSAAQIDWEYPLLLDRQEQTALAHVLTPVYLGEQTAM